MACPNGATQSEVGTLWNFVYLATHSENEPPLPLVCDGRELGALVNDCRSMSVLRKPGEENGGTKV